VNAYNLVGGASSANQYSGPTIPAVAAKLNARPGCAHGGVTIAERHVKKGNEHETLMKKSELGMQWFISQAIYNPEPMIRLLREYGALCKGKGVAPKRVILTFAPCGMTLVPKPWTLVPRPWTLVPKPWTLVPRPWTLVPKPSTLVPKICTLVHKPSALNPKP
jgi:hypothetical protein